MQLKSKNYHSISVSFPRQFMVNLLYPSAINLETIITINWLRSPNQTLPNIAIRYLRLNSVDFVLFGFCCVVFFPPVILWRQLPVTVCVFVFVGIVRQVRRRARFAISGIWQSAAVINGFPSTGDLSFQLWRHTVTWPSRIPPPLSNWMVASVSQSLLFLNPFSHLATFIRNGSSGHFQVSVSHDLFYVLQPLSDCGLNSVVALYNSCLCWLIQITTNAKKKIEMWLWSGKMCYVSHWIGRTQ